MGVVRIRLLFRKPTDILMRTFDVPVRMKDYSRGRWQIDAHGYWRKQWRPAHNQEELGTIPAKNLQMVYRKYSPIYRIQLLEHVDYRALDKDGNCRHRS